MNRKALIAITVAAVAVAAVVVGANITAHVPTASNGSPTQIASPGTASLLPVKTNPIQNTSTQPGLSIENAAAEDNVDPSTKQAIGDRLQITLKNSSTKTLTGFEVFYTMTDATTHASESYYLPLTDLTLPAGATTTIYFDNEKGPHHYPENRYSIYRSSTNKVDFAIQVSAKDVAIAEGAATKGAGTGEVVGG